MMAGVEWVVFCSLVASIGLGIGGWGMGWGTCNIFAGGSISWAPHFDTEQNKCSKKFHLNVRGSKPNFKKNSKSGVPFILE